MKNYWLLTAGILGALAIAFGAFGAHALPEYLEETGFGTDEVARRLDTFETGARYHMYAALAILVLGFGQSSQPRKAWSIACWLLLLGAAIFSGLLYVIAILGSDYRWLGAVVPIGGLMMIAGWVAVAIGAATAQKNTGGDP